MNPPTSDCRSLSLEKRFELMISGVQDYAIYFIDPDGYVTSWNAGAQRIKGYTAGEIIGRHFSIFYVPEDRDTGLPQRALRTALSEGKFEQETWRVRKDGTRFWASVVIDPVRDASGAHIGFVKITRDITERKRAEDALRESEQNFRLLVQGVKDYALFMLSPEGIVTSWNAGAERIKGYTADEIVGRHFSCFYTIEDQQKGMPVATLMRATSEGRAELEGWRVRKDGTPFWAHVVVDSIRDEAGRLIGFAKITRDITERQEAAETLERANAQLFQSQKMEAIGQLTGGIAHDFNNLLSVISNGIEVLQAQPSAHVASKMLEAMRRAVSRGATMTQQLLSFARQQPLAPEICELSSVTSSFESVLRRAVSSGINLHLERGSAVRPATIDIARFEAALLNLVVNARDAIAENGDIHVRVADVDLEDGGAGALKAGRYVRVSVTDSGCGMPPDVLAKATEPFFTTKEPGKGTGLGLSQVFGFMSQSGGEVAIQSQPGMGTTVSLYFPALEDDAVTVRLPDPVSETVLVVDDESEVLDATAELFRTIGYNVVTATSAKQALAHLASDLGIDFLFTDTVMPGSMDGMELAHRARRDHPALRVVVTSAHVKPALREEHETLDGFVFIPKPYRLADLAKVMRRA